MVSFNQIPTNLRIPFAAVEFDGSRAQQGPALLAYRGLIIGQKTSSGSAAANSLHKATNADQVIALAGRGSMLHTMAKAWFANNSSTECWIGVLEDNSSGVAATGTITLTGPATAAGTLSLYVAGTLVEVAVASGTTAAALGPLAAAAINAKTDLPVTAAAGSSGSEHIVTLTYRHKGLAGNAVDVRLNYQDGQATPAGIAAAIVAMASGTTSPVLTTLIAAMGDSWYNIIAHPYTDATSLTALETELASRSGPMRMIDGLAITSANGSQGTLSTLGDTRNSPHNCIISQPGESPLTPPCEFAAAVAAVVAYYGQIDPARPFQTLPIAGVLAPAESDLFTNSERNLLLYDGVSTSKVAAGGVVQIERICTTYQTNAAGSADTAFYDGTTMLTLMYARYSWRSRILTKFPRHKVADDGTRFGAGQAVVTPKILKAEAIAWFRDLEELGIFENFTQFKRDVVMARNAQDPNRVDMLLPPDFVNSFIVSAAQIQFRQ